MRDMIFEKFQEKDEERLNLTYEENALKLKERTQEEEMKLADIEVEIATLIDEMYKLQQQICRVPLRF